MKKKKRIKSFVVIVLCIFVLGAGTVFGVNSYVKSSALDYHTYAGQSMRECREILARCKDFVTTMFKPEPTHLGDAIPVSGNGDITNDKEGL